LGSILTSQQLGALHSVLVAVTISQSERMIEHWKQ